MMKKWIVLFSAVICVSFSGIFVRLANVSGFIAAFYRILFAFLIVLPGFIVGKKRISILDIITCIGGGFIFGFELALWNISVVLTNATIPTLLVNLSCIWISLFTYFAQNEKIRIAHWVGTGIALLGVVVLIGLPSIMQMKIELGLILAILCSMMISIYTIIVKSARSKANSISVLFYTLLGSMLALIVWSGIGKVRIIPQSRDSWLYLAGLGVIVQGFGYLGINYALGYISSTKVTLTLLLQPVFTGVLAGLLLDEKLRTNQIIGNLIVIIGLCVSLIHVSSSDKKV